MNGKYHRSRINHIHKVELGYCGNCETYNIYVDLPHAVMIASPIAQT